MSAFYGAICDQNTNKIQAFKSGTEQHSVFVFLLTNAGAIEAGSCLSIISVLVLDLCISNLHYFTCF
jgi:hypothetical protein